MLTAGALLSHGLAVPQGLETGQALRRLHADLLHDPPVGFEISTHVKMGLREHHVKTDRPFILKSQNAYFLDVGKYNCII